MGIFTRFRDIISSNINAMLDKAEEPEKMIKLIINEMEDALVEIKASCAGVMASTNRVQRQLKEAKTRADYWKDRAMLAIHKGRENLAREALYEKRRLLEKAHGFERELTEHNAISNQYKEDIEQLEDKLRTAKEKERALIKRKLLAENTIRAHKEQQRLDSADAVMRFEELENRIERMEAEADLINYGRKPLKEETFESTVRDEDIEEELTRIKNSSNNTREAALSV